MGLGDFLRNLFGGRATDQRRRPAARARAVQPRARHHRGEGGPGPDVERLRALGLPVLGSEAELAAALGVSARELSWLADPHRLAARRAPHYRLLVRRKVRGSRVILAPRPRLARVQRWILARILAELDLHPAVHGFRRGRDVLTNAAEHVGQDVLVRVDVENFFHQLTYRDVVGLFRAQGYGLEVARTLALLTTAAQRQMVPVLARREGLDPREVFAVTRQSRRGSRHPVLPQGAPTSPALANLLCRRLDRRMAGLARRFGARYTRYADDLAFSGGPDFRRDLRRFVPLVKRILREERLAPSPGKLRFARKGAQQRVTGVVVNAKPNTPAADYRLLRAILFNCAVHGPESQNRARHPRFREHLRGRVAHHARINPARGERLRAAFERIEW